MAPHRPAKNGLDIGPKSMSRNEIKPTTLMFPIPNEADYLRLVHPENNKPGAPLVLIVGFDQFQVQSQASAKGTVKCFHAYKTFTDSRRLEAARKAILDKFGVQSYTST